MAFGMKQWIAVTLVGLGLVAAWRLPPESPEPMRETVRTAEQIRFDQLSTEFRIASESLFRLGWADSLAREVVADHDLVTVLLPGSDEPALEAQRSRLEARIEQTLRARPGTRQMAFGLVFQPHDHRREDGAVNATERTETYVGHLNGVSYCMQVRVAATDYVTQAFARRVAGTDTERPTSDDLGPCRYYVSYGLAGARIQAWLEAGAVTFGIEAGDQPESELPGWYGGRRAPLGFSSVSRGPEGRIVDRCRAGLVSACSQYFEGAHHLVTSVQREVARRTPAVAVETTSGFRNAFRDQQYILSDLEAEFGPDAFQRFWTSERDVGEAFEAAFGVDCGTWLVSWIDRTMGVDPPGPGLSRSASSGAMLTFGVLLGFAYWRRRERTVAS